MMSNNISRNSKNSLKGNSLKLLDELDGNGLNTDKPRAPVGVLEAHAVIRAQYTTTGYPYTSYASL
jgi:hypothetical protein